MDAEWIEAVRAASALFEAIEGLDGAVDPQFGNAHVLECRNDAGHLLRRLSNLSLLHGVRPSDVERAKNNAGAGVSR